MCSELVVWYCRGCDSNPHLWHSRPVCYHCTTEASLMSPLYPHPPDYVALCHRGQCRLLQTYPWNCKSFSASKSSNYATLIKQNLEVFVCLLLLYILATSMVISWWISTCNSAHSWQLHSAASLGNQAIGTTTYHPTQSCYPDTEPTSACSMLIILSARLGSDKYQF